MFYSSTRGRFGLKIIFETRRLYYDELQNPAFVVFRFRVMQKNSFLIIFSVRRLTIRPIFFCRQTTVNIFVGFRLNQVFIGKSSL